MERPRALPALASAGLVLALALPGARGAWRHSEAATGPVPVSLASRRARVRTTLAQLAARQRTVVAAHATAAVALRVARRSLAVAQRQLERRLRELYEDGDAHPLEVVLGARSLGDAITGLDSLERAASQNRAWIAQVGALRERLARLSTSLAARRAAAHRLRVSAAATAAALAELQAPAPQPATHTVAAPPAPATVTTITVIASAYALRGATATGTSAGPGTIAVDPAVIPLGTPLTVPGYGRESPPTPAAPCAARASMSGSRRLRRRLRGEYRL